MVVGNTLILIQQCRPDVSRREEPATVGRDFAAAVQERRISAPHGESKLTECVTANDLILHWAVDHGYLCYRAAATVSGERREALMVVLHHVRVYFEDGALARIEYPNDAKLTVDASQELALVFALCGCVSLVVESQAKRPGRPAKSPSCVTGRATAEGSSVRET